MIRANRFPGVLLRAVATLMLAQWWIARNTFWRGKRSRKLVIFMVAGVLAAGAWGLYRLMLAAVRGLTSPEFAEALRQAVPGGARPLANVREYLLALPSLLLLGMLLLLVLTSFSRILSSLYLASDIDMYVVAPVPMRAVFIVKFFGALVVPYTLLFLLVGPALLGFGRGLQFNPLYFVVLALVLALFPLLPAGLGALLVLAVVRVIPPRRARDIVGLLGGLVGVSTYIISQFGREVTERYANVRTLEALRRLDVMLLPSSWAGRALIAAGQGDWMALLGYGGLFAALSVGLFTGCVVMAERLYYIGWSKMAAQGGRVHRRSARPDTSSNSEEGPQVRGRYGVGPALTRWLPQPSRVILQKDLRIFRRDLRNFQRVIFPLALAVIWTFRLLTDSDLSRATRRAGTLGTIELWGATAISLFICVSLSDALVGSGINRDGKGFWIMRVAPVSARQILLGKFALAYTPFPIVGTLMVTLFGVLQGNDSLAIVRSLALILIVGLGTSGIGLGFGAAFPRLEWVNPQQQVSFRAGCLAPLCSLLYVLLAVGFALGLPALGVLQPRLAPLFLVAGWLMLVACTVGTAWVAISWGASRLERIEL